MVELGWSAIPWGEEHGGLAFGYKGLGVVTEETGRTLTASPLFASVWAGGTLINIGGSDAQKGEILPQIASGETSRGRGGRGGSPPRAVYIATKAAASGDGYTLTRQENVCLRRPRGGQTCGGRAYQWWTTAIAMASRYFW